MTTAKNSFELGNITFTIDVHRECFRIRIFKKPTKKRKKESMKEWGAVVGYDSFDFETTFTDFILT